MKNLFCLILMTLSYKTIYAQNIKGIILSSKDNFGVEGAHIINITKKNIAISSELGYFNIKGEIGDTLVVSNINFDTKQFIVNAKTHLSIVLNPANIQLDEVLVSNLPTTAEDFRKKLITMPMQDNGKFLPFGMKPAKPRSEIPPLYNRSLNSGLGYVVMNPLKSITRKLNSEFQEKVKYYALKADENDKIIRDKKFNRSLVASLTELEGDELTDFIHFLDFADSFIASASAYEIAEKIKEEFKKFEKLVEEDK
ncbi:hypothetical protein QYS49_39695 [Marivirga salinae]|uniref:Carboxypeptidase-like regulatory domain-containing protein n=1 Tax=Marivirga salinarum TaxID=3059078 RepID=A0AA51NB90_9BACT|nr:hypothetical protein [Marivirga sp. BDSF4-3]WMN11829.1 hypothetical protein QYS49_39695 [Marivirga sp. BDSF4-3]